MRLPARVTTPGRVALVLLALSPALAACGGEEEASVGDVISARKDDQFAEGRTGRLTLPTGRLEVTVGEPATSLAANDTRELEPIEAPDGASFVPITWQYDAGTFGDYADYTENDEEPVFDLVADGANYRLPPPNPTGVGSESFYVVVNGAGESPSLNVDFDGVTQTLDLTTGQRDPGLAKPLYKLKSRNDRTQSCASDVTFGKDPVGAPSFACTTTRTARIPYAGGAWAEDGHSWLVVSVTTAFRRWDVFAKDGKSGAIYAATGVESTFRLGDIKPTQVIEDRLGSSCPDATRGCLMTYHLIFDVEGSKVPKRLKVDQDYEFTLLQVWGGGDGKQTITVPLKVDTLLRSS
ncbi:hypothetical protein ACFQ0K_13565 [Nocardioides caeni]|uniref:Uncharacterized protein n=1 Tax=Nocardioides caeni TaxID=574700 RepID=A0A4S8N283_9ACTN|nr:hypothetical protein [Nocardioides caeni]THV08904.1 hypothetical protein E9934_18345 [Nocardioides caeni]